MLTITHMQYLLSIYASTFDQDVHSGRYVDAGETYTNTIHDLLRAGLVRYDGTHSVTSVGVAYVLKLLKVT